MAKVLKHTIIIGIIGTDNRPVGGCSFGYDKIGAADIVGEAVGMDVEAAPQVMEEVDVPGEAAW